MQEMGEREKVGWREGGGRQGEGEEERRRELMRRKEKGGWSRRGRRAWGVGVMREMCRESGHGPIYTHGYGV